MKQSVDFDGARAVTKIWEDELGATLATFENTHEESGLLATDSKSIGANPSTDRQFQWNDNGALSKVDQDEITWDARLLTSTGQRDLTYEATTGRLTQSTDGTATTDYTYDSKGNRKTAVSGGTTTNYSWNLLNQLTKLDSTSFSYSMNGIRTKVGTAAQVYDQGLKLLSDGQNKYLWSPDGALLAQAPLDSTRGSETQQVVTDTMGSVYAVLDTDLAVLGEYSYTTFGERMLTAGADVSSMGFTSEQHDDSGLIYLRYRYMDPTVGQFISVDPMLSSTLDAYGYASGNPLQMVDPLGLFSWGDVGDTLYNNSSDISTGFGVAALAVGATGIGAPIAAGLGLISTGFSIVSAIKNFREGNTTDAWVDVASAALGVVGGGAYVRGLYQAAKARKIGAPFRRDLKNNIKNATAPSKSVQNYADNASAGMLAALNGGKGALC